MWEVIEGVKQYFDKNKIGYLPNKEGYNLTRSAGIHLPLKPLNSEFLILTLMEVSWLW